MDYRGDLRISILDPNPVSSVSLFIRKLTCSQPLNPHVGNVTARHAKLPKRTAKLPKRIAKLPKRTAKLPEKEFARLPCTKRSMLKSCLQRRKAPRDRWVQVKFLCSLQI